MRKTQIEMEAEQSPVTILERLAFLVHTQELINHYAPVFDALARAGAAFDILTHREPITITPEQRAAWGCGVIKQRRIRNLGQKYRCLVTNHFIAQRNGRLLHSLAVENIRFMYAAGKSAHNLAPWNTIYDGILCFGPYHAGAFKARYGLPTYEMGFPRFDRYFTETPDMPALYDRFGCDPAKRTIVWLPTWLELSSVGLFNDEIAALCADYNVVVKVHPLMPQSEPDRIASLRALPLTRLIETAEDNIPLYQLADFMLFDYGGPAFGAIYAGKRFILLDVPQAAADTLTGPDSSDIGLRQVFRHVGASDRGIRGVLEDDATWAAHGAACADQSARYFAPHQGTAAQHAARALIDRSWLTKGTAP
ncbi:hypothetical protein FHS89_001653 [Rubricella aquisinus]|uniref:CDP-Glycerol:Poly(Glycerophosphate) glycerophosphotransferase n=1 Tax=Rubricella aquisinus TaxID=2028108 RepID=A0A840WM57_9RHOB|nr:CDP-glycerol glycerophosphotransferase family protein [Rubricella aquisinus]MBB5515641.1 hypothetical protein [Rubricella aquisinus]